jgi:hypothetical protein
MPPRTWAKHAVDCWFVQGDRWPESRLSLCVELHIADWTGRGGESESWIQDGEVDKCVTSRQTMIGEEKWARRTFCCTKHGAILQ